jgi:hypothetical protein
MPDSNAGETSVISKHNLPDLNVDADLHGSAATLPDDVEQDPLAAADDDEPSCVNCGQTQWLSPDGARCYYCATDQPAHRGRAKRVVELRCHPGAHILGVR